MVEDNTGTPRLPEDIEDPLIGKVLNGRFRIVERIGAGGMGRVYKAMQLPLERPVAVKILNANFGAGKDPNFQKRFFLEASITSKLQHPNTITVIDYGRLPEGLFFLAMEYVQGHTLSELLTQNGPLPWQRAMQIAQQVCRSVREAHRYGVIHRDLKPANIMILREDREHDLVKVLDFGLVKTFSGEAPQPERELEITQAGMLLGSPQYMSPEQARHKADPRSDVYSLGAVMFHMLTGRPPFIGRDSIDVIVKHMQQPVPTFRSIRPDLDVPADIEALTMKMLEKDPARRFQSMDEVLDGMRRCGVAMGLSGLFAEPRAATPPRDGPATELPPTASSSQLAALPPPRRGLLFATLFVGSLLLGAIAVLALALKMRFDETAPVAPVPVAPAVVTAAPEPAPPVLAPTVAPAPVPAPDVVPEETTVIDMVDVRVETQPAGARVLLNGRRLGETPLDMQLPRGADGAAAATIWLSLDGYQPESVVIRETSDRGVVNRQLTKRRVGKAPAKAPSRSSVDGYKEDPYE